MVETGNRTIKQKSTLQHILNGVKKHCGELKKVPMFKIGSVG